MLQDLQVEKNHEEKTYYTNLLLNCHRECHQNYDIQPLSKVFVCKNGVKNGVSHFTSDSENSAKT